MNVKLISSTQGKGEFEGKSVEEMIVYVARGSSSREDKFENPAGLLKYCINNKHWSIFETGSITMEIKTSKAIGIQLLRHRSFTFQEFSQRYATVTEIEPIELREQHTNNRQSSTNVFNPIVNMPVMGEESINVNADLLIKDLITNCQEVYESLLDAGVARECARMVLPLATSTTIYMTGSVRSWIHMLGVRDDSHAQKEIQKIAKEIKKIFIKECPIISKALGYE